MQVSTKTLLTVESVQVGFLPPELEAGHRVSGASAPLGNNPISPTPPTFEPRGFGLFTRLMQAKKTIEYGKTAIARRLEKFALQREVRRAIPKSRAASCLRLKIGSSGVGVKWSPSRGKANYVNVRVCGAGWVCPHCAPKISEHRRKELLRLLKEVKRRGQIAVLVTRTIRHSPHDGIKDLMDAMQVAEGKFKSGNPWGRLVNRFGVIGGVRALETTFSEGGPHPHLHEILILKGKVDFKELRDAISVRWASAVGRAGLGTISDEFGVDVRGGAAAAGYIAKFGKESELTSWHTKQGRGGAGPFDLLRLSQQCEDQSIAAIARALFAEFAEATKGRKQLSWSKGLRKEYGLNEEEVSDEDAAVGEEALDDVVIGKFTDPQWSAICRAGLRGQVLEAVNASGGDWSAVDEVLGEALARESG